MSDLRQRFAARIKARRLELALLQGDVADACGVSQPTVSAWEAGDKYPAVPKLFALARRLDLDVDDLLNPEPAGSGSNGGTTVEPEPVPAAATAGVPEPPGLGRHTAQETALSGGPLFGPESKSHA